MVPRTSNNPSTWWMEAEVSGVQGQPGLYQTVENVRESEQTDLLIGLVLGSPWI